MTRDVAPGWSLFKAIWCCVGIRFCIPDIVDIRLEFLNPLPKSMWLLWSKVWIIHNDGSSTKTELALVCREHGKFLFRK